MLQSCGFGIDLTKEVYLQAAVNRNHLIILGNDIHIVNVLNRSDLHHLVIIDPVIKLLRTHREGIGHLALVDLLVAGQLACLEQVQISVYEHFGVNA